MRLEETRFIFFDAGNTLVFPDLSRTLAPLEAAGFRAAQEQLYAAERAAKRLLDAAQQRRSAVLSVDRDFWTIYYQHLLQSLGAPEELCADLVAATRRSGHWSRVQPGTRAVLEALRSAGR